MIVTNNGNTEKSEVKDLQYMTFPHFFQQYHSAAFN